MIEIKKILSENPIYIENILNKLEFHKIRKYKDSIICGNSPDGKGLSIHIKLNETLLSKDFKYSISGDFISFIMQKRNLDFIQIINIIKEEIGIEYIEFNKQKCNGVFGGKYNKIKRCFNITEYNKLDENILDKYKGRYSLRFLQDKISLETQKKFNIGYDVETQRITIPWRDYEGNLIGIMGRNNIDDDNITKYLPIIPFPKRSALYGYCENYSSLQGSDDIYIFESEKSVLICDSLKINNCVALGRNEICLEQIKKIIQLEPNKIIFCLDEGLNEEVSIKNINLVKSLLKYSNIQVGYVYDSNNDILEKDSKNSPIDNGIEDFKQLIQNYVKWR